mmetsp:Transcript_4301/g.18177  ORF Transcript_4301/g.18177 Transcript_4301/m.18177 type:complete len:372 (+) Transcript_4301:1034-2149(+)
MTEFQSSPVRTWNTVTKAQRRSSKWARGRSNGSGQWPVPWNCSALRPVTGSKQSWLAKNCMPMRLKMNMNSSSSTAKYATSLSVRRMVCSSTRRLVHCLARAKTRNRRKVRRAEMPPPPAAMSSVVAVRKEGGITTTSTSVVMTMRASNALKGSRTYRRGPSPTTLTIISRVKSTVSTKLTTSSAAATSGSMGWWSAASTLVLTMMATMTRKFTMGATARSWKKRCQAGMRRIRVAEFIRLSSDWASSTVISCLATCASSSRALIARSRSSGAISSDTIMVALADSLGPRRRRRRSSSAAASDASGDALGSPAWSQPLPAAARPPSGADPRRTGTTAGPPRWPAMAGEAPPASTSDAKPSVPRLVPGETTL